MTTNGIGRHDGNFHHQRIHDLVNEISMLIENHQVLSGSQTSTPPNPVTGSNCSL